MQVSVIFHGTLRYTIKIFFAASYKGTTGINIVNLVKLSIIRISWTKLYENFPEI
jgi:hypothetical protein